MKDTNTIKAQLLVNYKTKNPEWYSNSVSTINFYLFLNKLFTYQLNQICYKYNTDPNLMGVDLIPDQNDRLLISILKKYVEYSNVVFNIIIFTFFVLISISSIFNYFLVGISFLILSILTIICKLYLDKFSYLLAKIVKRKNYFKHPHLIKFTKVDDSKFKISYFDNETFYPIVGRNNYFEFTLNSDGILEFVNSKNTKINSSSFKEYLNLINEIIYYQSIQIQ